MPADRVVIVWRIDLDRSPGDCSVLPEDERSRAARFVSPRDRRRWIAGQVALRCILGTELGCPPAQLQFRRQPGGKRLLDQADPGFGFSLSDAQHLALVALARCPTIGVDLDHECGLRDPTAVSDWLDRVGAPPNAKLLDRWTHTEAVAKALGIGLPGLEAGWPPAASELELHPIDLGPAWAAAVAVAGQGWRVRCRDWLGASIRTMGTRQEEPLHAAT